MNQHLQPFISFWLAREWFSETVTIYPLGIILAKDQNDACQQANLRWPDYAKMMVMPWQRVPAELRIEAIANDW